MIEPYRDGDVIWAPADATGTNPGGGPVIGIGYLPVSPGDPDYEEWDAYLRFQANRERTGRGPGGRIERV